MPVLVLACLAGPFITIAQWWIGRRNQSRDKEHNLHASEEVYQMRSGFSQGHLYQCSLFTPIAHSSRLLPQCSRNNFLSYILQ